MASKTKKEINWWYLRWLVENTHEMPTPVITSISPSHGMAHTGEFIWRLQRRPPCDHCSQKGPWLCWVPEEKDWLAQAPVHLISSTPGQLLLFTLISTDTPPSHPSGNAQEHGFPGALTPSHWWEKRWWVCNNVYISMWMSLCDLFM